jgi:lysosomal-associated membrane protein 1/2
MNYNGNSGSNTRLLVSAPDVCEGDVRTSDLVPIVVGACLAALVIIVLVAYLIGRARAKRQGYASV